MWRRRVILGLAIIVAFAISAFVYPLTVLLFGVPAILILTDFKDSRARMMRVFRWVPWVGGKPFPLGGVLLVWAVLAAVFGTLIYGSASVKTTASHHPVAIPLSSVTAVVHSPPYLATHATSRPSVTRVLQPKPASSPQRVQTFPSEVFSMSVFAKAFHQAMAEEAGGIHEVTGLDISAGNGHTVIPPMQDAQKRFQHAAETFIRQSGGSPYDDVGARAIGYFTDVEAAALTFLGNYPDPPTKANYEAIHTGYRGLLGIQQELAAKGY